MDDLKCPVVGCKREFSNRFNRDEHAEKCRREWQAGKRAKHGQQSMFGFFSKAPAQPAAQNAANPAAPEAAAAAAAAAPEAAAPEAMDVDGAHAEASLPASPSLHAEECMPASFCGGTSCTPYITPKEQPGQLEGCPSFAKFSSAPCKKDRGQCNNVPLLCPECTDGAKQVVWKYGMAAHYAAKHPQQRVKEEQPFEMGPKEVKHMQKVAKGVHM